MISAYHTSEGIIPRPERIAWAVDLSLRHLHPGLLLVADQNQTLVGVALATYSPSAELGRVLTVNDFYVNPPARRKGVGRSMAQKLLEEAKKMRIDQIDLGVLKTNSTAAAFWKSLGFQTEGRTVYSRVLSRLSPTRKSQSPVPNDKSTMIFSNNHAAPAPPRDRNVRMMRALLLI